MPDESHVAESESTRDQYAIRPSSTMEETVNLFLQGTNSQISRGQKRQLEPDMFADFIGTQQDDSPTSQHIDAPLLLSSIYARKKPKAANRPSAKKKQPRPEIHVAPLASANIEIPNEQDVLCGRGGRINTHPGNVALRDLVSMRQLDYLSNETKKLDKAYIAAEIVAEIRTQHGGRFLRQKPEDQTWYEIGDERAIRKVLQALREHAPEIRPMMAPW